MTTITIKVEDDIISALNQMAKQKSITTEALVKDALLSYLGFQIRKSPKYSFIGIGHSGKKNLSKQAETKLEKAANKQNGWSLPE